MKSPFYALLLLLLIVSCKGNDITGEAVTDVEKALTGDSCEETDNGIDTENKGYVSGLKDGKTYNVVDRCIAGLLVEYYCEDNKPVNQNIRCPGKCSDGACV